MNNSVVDFKPYFRVKRDVILLMDEDGNERKSIQQMLESEGYPVIGVGDRKEAVDAVRLMPRDIRLVISKLDTPGVKRREFAQSLRYLSPTLKIVFGFGKKPDKPSENAGPNTLLTYFVPTPFERSSLLSAVGEALA